MKKVSFTEMKNGTKDDYLFLDKHEKDFANKTSDKIYHCNKNDEVDVFLEDYVYYCLALLSYYEIEGN